jgi:hypothetical protein
MLTIPIPASYVLPIASGSVLGGIKVGTRLSITDGVLSADVQTTDISGKENVGVAAGLVSDHAALLTGVHGLSITSGKVLTVQDNVTISGALGTAAYVAESAYALLAGRAGGQTLIGGTAASETLTLQSTSNATKGKILFGTSAYDEVNNRLGIGTTSPNNTIQVANLINFDNTDFNTKLGYQAGLNIVAGAQYNTFLGYQAGLSSATLSTNAADYNTGIGYQALYSNTTGYQNTANGVNALLYNTTGNLNTANGVNALRSNTTGYQNTVNGVNALRSNTTGNNNTANGMQALYFNTTGNNNTANGMQALYDLGIAQTAGSFNVGTSYTIKTIGTTDFTLIGAASNTVGVVFTATGVGSGTGTATPNNTNSNTALGYNTGRGIIYGTGNTILGANVAGLAAGLTNNIIIADGAGNQRINVDSNGNVGIGTTSPTAVLHLKAGTATASTAPFKFTSGVSLTTAEVGAIEFTTDDFFATITTGASRKGIVLDDGARLTSGKIPVATTNGRLVDLTAQAHEADAKADYAAGDLDTEAEVITTINATNAKINALLVKLENLKLLATS